MLNHQHLLFKVFVFFFVWKYKYWTWLSHNIQIKEKSYILCNITLYIYIYIYIYISNILLIKKSNDVINLQIITKKKKTQIYVNKTTINRHGYTSNSTLSIQNYSKPSNQYYYVLLTKQAKNKWWFLKHPKFNFPKLTLERERVKLWKKGR